jgi:hypothetical protein
MSLPLEGRETFFGFFEIIPILLIGLIIFVAATIGSERRDPDPTGRRPYAIYLVSLTFVAMFVLLLSATALVSAVVQIPLKDDGPYAYSVEEGSGRASYGERVEVAAPPVSQPPSGAGLTPAPPRVAPPPRPVPFPVERLDRNREHIRGAVQAGLIAVAAGLVLLFHWRRLRELIGEPGFAEGPARRTYQVYLYAVCFVSILALLAAGALAAFGLFRIIAPGTTDIGGGGFERDRGVSQFATNVFLALATSWIFVVHWRRTASFRTPPAAAQPEGPPAL